MSEHSTKAEKARETIYKELDKLESDATSTPTVLRLCDGLRCALDGYDEIFEALLAEKDKNLALQLRLMQSGEK